MSTDKSFLGGFKPARTSAWLLVGGLLLAQPSPGAVVINEIYFDPKNPSEASEFIELFNPGSTSANLEGCKLQGGVKFSFSQPLTIAPGAFVIIAADPKAFQKVFKREALGPWKGHLKHSGESLSLVDAAGTKLDGLTYSVGFPWPAASAGSGSSIELLHPAADHQAGSSWRASGYPLAGKKNPSPTPGAPNSVSLAEPPPGIRSVSHLPEQPHAGESVKIEASVTAANGVRSVLLEYQTVDPGHYVRKTDPAYQKNWTSLPMSDEGKDGDLRAKDQIYTAILPGTLQTHRRLVRYRVVITDQKDQTIRAPFEDDASPNFAYYSANGAPAWVGAAEPGKSPTLTFPASLMETLPALTLIANQDEVEHSQWDGGWNKRKLLGTLVCAGRVYDHIQFNNRGQGSTHVSGKNKWAFHFNPARGFHALDQWGQPFKKPWKSINLNACASPWVQSNRGMAGLDEAVSFRAYELAGVPSPRVRHAQLRVVASELEASPKDQFAGDLWGLYLIVEEPNGNFLNQRDLPDGNVYRAGGGPDKSHQASTQALDNRDFEDFLNQARRNPPEAWWRANIDLPSFFSFHAISRLVGNVDLREVENHYLYHRPDGRWVAIPWDLDMMFIPKSHQSGHIDQDRCLAFPALRLEYANRCRELLDLLCADPSPNGGQIGQVIDELAQVVHPANQPLAWPELDMCRWNFHPRTNDKGAFYRNPVQGGPDNNWKRILASADFFGFTKFITEFCTPSRPPGATWKLDDGDPKGYGYHYLAHEAEDSKAPQRPTLRLMGSLGPTAQDLRFECSAFEPAAGGAPFASMQLRLGEISAPGIPGYTPGTPRRFEIEPLWSSPEISPFQPLLQIPADAVLLGRTYRARVRMKDSSGRWSRWSEPVQLTIPAKK